MLHLALYGLLAIVVAGGLFFLAARFLPAGEQIAPPLRDEPSWELPPERRLYSGDIDSVRLPVALRGYRFAETDILLDRLAGELRARDEEIARLRGHAPAEAAAGPVPEPSAQLERGAESDPDEQSRWARPEQPGGEFRAPEDGDARS